jgi:hypothetical protein
MIGEDAQTHANYFDAVGDSSYFATGYYYDYGVSLHQTAAYTGDLWWTTKANTACAKWLQWYVTPNNGVIPGYANYTKGLRLDWERSAVAASKAAAILLSTNAAYAPDYTPEENTEWVWNSREVACTINAMIDAELLGETHRDRMELLITQAISHIDQMCVSKTIRVEPGNVGLPDLIGMYYIQPFMIALTCRALINYYEHIGQDSRILPTVEIAANFLWDEAWVADDQAFWYDNHKDPTTDPELDGPWLENDGGVLDLNMIIAPVFAWAWSMTGTQRHLDRGDAAFYAAASDPAGSALNYMKQFNQNYLWSFDYVRWRSGG